MDREQERVLIVDESGIYRLLDEVALARKLGARVADLDRFAVGSVGQRAPDVRGNRVDDVAQLLGDPPRLRVGPLAGL